MQEREKTVLHEQDAKLCESKIWMIKMLWCLIIYLKIDHFYLLEIVVFCQYLFITPFDQVILVLLKGAKAL